MRYICFTLTMPNRGSWNGKWSGENNFYAIVKKFNQNKKTEEKINKILEKKNYYYHWNDGWGANVEVKEVTGRESTQIKKKSKGFWGYDWMVDSIINHGVITTK